VTLSPASSSKGFGRAGLLTLTVVVGVAAFLGANAGVILGTGKDSGVCSQIYRVLPWTELEQRVFIAHIALYPIVSMIGGSIGRGLFGSLPRFRWPGALFAAFAVFVLSMTVQSEISQGFMATQITENWGSAEICEPNYSAEMIRQGYRFAAVVAGVGALALAVFAARGSLGRET